MNIKNFKMIAMGLPSSVSVMIRGPQGIGKSEVVGQIAEGFGLPLIDRRLSQLTEADIIGLPKLDNDVTKFCPPDWYKQACDEPVVLFLDELNRAQQGVIQASFQIVLDRQLNGYKLHPDTRIFVSINQGNQFIVNELDPAKLDRYYVVDLEPSVEEWLEHATARSVWPVVVEYIRKYPEQLDSPPKYEPQDRVQSRRSWLRFALSANTSGLAGDDLDFSRDGAKRNHLKFLADGFLGSNASALFIDYVKEATQQITIEDVLDNFPKESKRISAAGPARWMTVVERIAVHSTKEIFTPEQVANYAKFCEMLPFEQRTACWCRIAHYAQLDESKAFLDNLKNVSKAIATYIREATNSDSSGETTKKKSSKKKVETEEEASTP